MLRDQLIVQDDYANTAYYPAKTASVERKFEADRAYGGPSGPPPALYTRAGCNRELDNTQPRSPWSIGPNLHGAVYLPRIEALSGENVEAFVGGLAGADYQLLIFILLIALVIYQYVMLKKICARLEKMKAKAQPVS
jgi:hypothetical protein